MDDIQLIAEVEKFREVYDPQHVFYKDNSRKEKCWDEIATAVGATIEDCKRRWKQLRDSFVKSKNKNVPSGSAAGTVKDWKYSNVMSFLLPHTQPRSSKSSLQPVHLEDTPVDLICREEMVTEPYRLPSRPSTPLIPTQRSISSSPHPTEVGQRSVTPTQQLSGTQRSATPTQQLSGTQRSATPTQQLSGTQRSATPPPPPHPRVQVLASESTRQAPQPSRKKSRGSTGTVSAEQHLVNILEAEKVPVPPHVPTDAEEMYFFSLSLVPRLNRLPRSTQARAQVHILQYLANLEQEEEEIHTQALVPRSTHWQQTTTQPQPSAFQAYPPPTTYQGPAQPPSMSQAHHSIHPGRPGGVKRSTSMLEELEDSSTEPTFHHF